MEISKDLLKHCEDRLSKSIMQLMRNPANAFVVNLILNLEREPSDKVKSIELSGATYKFNPEFVNTSSDRELLFSLVHVAWHIGFLDELRAHYVENRELWNQAADIYNNLMIKEDSNNDITVPSWAKCDYKFKNKEKEDIYKYLLENQPDKKEEDKDKLSGDLTGNNDDSNEGENQGNPQEQLEQLKKQLESVVQQAAMQAKVAGGQIPEHIQRYLDDLYNPKLPWERILIKYMNDYNKNDYSYKRINKKLFPHNILIPSLYSDGLGNIVIANDESGSVSDEEYKTYIGAITDIHTRLNPLSMHILNFTTHIVSEHKIMREGDISKINFRGSGGTHIPCVFEHIEKNNIKPQVLIIFSDMESEIPSKKPNYDVIWISVNNRRFKHPFGRCIHIDVK